MTEQAEDEKLVLEFKRRFYDNPREVIWPIYLVDGVQCAGTPVYDRSQFAHKGTCLVYAIRVIPKVNPDAQ